jgi:Na+-transporting NADH:ubiquinone oxidoreductase subunit C
MQGSVRYNLIFATIVCVVCAVFVSASNVGLRGKQAENATLDKYRNVLLAVGLVKDGEKLSADEIQQRFEPMQQVVIDLKTGEETDIDPSSFDQRKAAADPAESDPAPPNAARVQRIPHHALIYRLVENGETKAIVLPIHGAGLWSTLYGFLALDADLETIRGLTYYEQGETAGLGGEVDNPRWKALWPGRKAFTDDFEPEISVIKGKAGPPSEDPYHVDGLSGATITSRSVTYMLHFWLGDEGFAPYLRRLSHGG